MKVGQSVKTSKPESYKNFEVRTFNLHSSHLKQKRMKSYQWFWYLKWHHTWNDIFHWHNNDTSPEVYDVFYGHCTVGIVCVNRTVVPTLSWWELDYCLLWNRIISCICIMRIVLCWTCIIDDCSFFLKFKNWKCIMRYTILFYIR